VTQVLRGIPLVELQRTRTAEGFKQVIIDHLNINLTVSDIRFLCAEIVVEGRRVMLQVNDATVSVRVTYSITYFTKPGISPLDLQRETSEAIASLRAYVSSSDFIVDLRAYGQTNNLEDFNKLSASTVTDITQLFPLPPSPQPTSADEGGFASLIEDNAVPVSAALGSFLIFLVVGLFVVRIILPRRTPKRKVLVSANGDAMIEAALPEARATSASVGRNDGTVEAVVTKLISIDDTLDRSLSTKGAVRAKPEHPSRKLDADLDGKYIDGSSAVKPKPGINLEEKHPNLVSLYQNLVKGQGITTPRTSMRSSTRFSPRKSQTPRRPNDDLSGNAAQASPSGLSRFMFHDKESSGSKENSEKKVSSGKDRRNSPRPVLKRMSAAEISPRTSFTNETSRGNASDTVARGWQFARPTVEKNTPTRDPTSVSIRSQDDTPLPSGRILRHMTDMAANDEDSSKYADPFSNPDVYSLDLESARSPSVPLRYEREPSALRILSMSANSEDNDDDYYAQALNMHREEDPNVDDVQSARSLSLSARNNRTTTLMSSVARMLSIDESQDEDSDADSLGDRDDGSLTYAIDMTGARAAPAQPPSPFRPEVPRLSLHSGDDESNVGGSAPKSHLGTSPEKGDSSVPQGKIFTQTALLKNKINTSRTSRENYRIRAHLSSRTNASGPAQPLSARPSYEQTTLPKKIERSLTDPTTQNLYMYESANSTIEASPGRGEAEMETGHKPWALAFEGLGFGLGLGSTSTSRSRMERPTPRRSDLRNPQTFRDNDDNNWNDGNEIEKR
jgi:hypothetical protein